MKIVHGSQPILSTTCRPLCDLPSSRKEIQCQYFQDLYDTLKSTLTHFDFKYLLECHPAITLPKIAQDFFAEGLVRHL